MPSKKPANAKRDREPVWALEDAQARFGEIVHRARRHGPQYVTVKGKTAVAIIDAAELERLLPTGDAPLPLVDFLESLYAPGLDLKRDHDRGCDAAL